MRAGRDVFDDARPGHRGAGCQLFPGARKAAPAGTRRAAPTRGSRTGRWRSSTSTDGQVLAYCVGGLVLDVPAKSLPALVDWTLKEAKLGQPKLSGPGKDADPLLVLTEAALERYGLPVAPHRGGAARRADPGGPQGHQAAGPRGVEADEARVRAVGADLPPRHGLGAGLRAAVHPVVERAGHPALGRRRAAPAGGARPGPGHVRVPGDDAARLHRRDRPGADDRAAPADPRLRAGRRRQAALRAQPRLAGQGPGGLARRARPPTATRSSRTCRASTSAAPAEKLFEEAYDWARPMTDAECTLRAPGRHRREHGLRRRRQRPDRRPRRADARQGAGVRPEAARLAGWSTCPTSTCRG